MDEKIIRQMIAKESSYRVDLDYIYPRCIVHTNIGILLKVSMSTIVGFLSKYPDIVPYEKNTYMKNICKENCAILPTDLTNLIAEYANSYKYQLFTYTKYSSYTRAMLNCYTNSCYHLSDTYIDCSLMIVSHVLFFQWKEKLEKQPNLRVKYLNKSKDFNFTKQDIVNGFLNKYDLVLCNVNKIKDLYKSVYMHFCCKWIDSNDSFVWKRVLLEYHILSHIRTKRIPYLKSHFLWIMTDCVQHLCQPLFNFETPIQLMWKKMARKLRVTRNSVLRKFVIIGPKSNYKYRKLPTARLLKKNIFCYFFDSLAWYVPYSLIYKCLTGFQSVAVNLSMFSVQPRLSIITSRPILKLFKFNIILRFLLTAISEFSTAMDKQQIVTLVLFIEKFITKHNLCMFCLNYNENPPVNMLCDQCESYTNFGICNFHKLKKLFSKKDMNLDPLLPSLDPPMNRSLFTTSFSKCEYILSQLQRNKFSKFIVFADNYFWMKRFFLHLNTDNQYAAAILKGNSDVVHRRMKDYNNNKLNCLIVPFLYADYQLEFGKTDVMFVCNEVSFILWETLHFLSSAHPGCELHYLKYG